MTIPALWRQLIETEKGIGNLVPAGAGFGFFYFSQRAYGFARCVFSLYIKRKKAPNGRRAVRSLAPSGKGGCGGV